MTRSTTDSGALPVPNWLNGFSAPQDRPYELLDTRDLPPPKPLQETLERLPEIDDDVVFVQLNDRSPKLLYPKLDHREYQYETKTVDPGVLTVIWR